MNKKIGINWLLLAVIFFTSCGSVHKHEMYSGDSPNNPYRVWLKPDANGSYLSSLERHMEDIWQYSPQYLDYNGPLTAPYVETLEQLPPIKSLKLNKWIGRGDEEIDYPALVKFFQWQPELTILDMQNCEVTAEDIDVLSDVFGKFEKLNLAWNDIGWREHLPYYSVLAN